MTDPAPLAERSAIRAFERSEAPSPSPGAAAVHARFEPPPIGVGRRLVGVAGGGLLLYLTWTGATGFLRQWPQATGIGQYVQTGSELVYAFGALFSVVTTTRLRRWAGIARRTWVVGATIAGGLAPTVWGGASTWLSLMTTAASLGLACGLLWMLRRGFPSSD